MIGDKIKSLREARGWSQKRLSDESGVAQPHICNLEKGVTKGGRAETITKIAAALDVTVEELMQEAI